MTKPFPHALSPGYFVFDALNRNLGFMLRPSANAWWLDQTVLSKILLALSMGSTVLQARTFAGITARQYKYFLRLHPESRHVISSYREAFQKEVRRIIDKEPEMDAWGKYFYQHAISLTPVPSIRRFKSLQEWEEKTGALAPVADEERVEFDRILRKEAN